MILRKTLLLAVFSLIIAGFRPIWGFFAHEKINRLAVFTLPRDMLGFYKKNIDLITEAAVDPDKRRYVVKEEGARHFMDVDHYGDSAFLVLPQDWNGAVALFTEDTLQSHGILPWHIYRMYHQLRDAFFVRDPARILRVSAELGHYISDAHVPLHTTKNYNGQLTRQDGIHAFWESRLPELFSSDYNFLVGRAEYIRDPRAAAWQMINTAHQLVDQVLTREKELGMRYEEKKYAFETRGKVTVKVYSADYSRDYHIMLEGMVEQQMRASIRMVGAFWYTAWVDAGQPDLKGIMNYKPTEEELRKNREAYEAWMERRYPVRGHD